MWSSGVLCSFSQSMKVSYSCTSSQVLGVGWWVIKDQALPPRGAYREKEDRSKNKQL